MRTTKKQPFVYSILIDFDGVLHSYTSGWQRIDVITDGPVEGAMEWLMLLMANDRFKPIIYSSRSRSPKGIRAMKDAIIDWLVLKKCCEEDLACYLVDCKLSFPREKPPAFLSIDDRAICFDGKFPSMEQMADFKPWYQK